MKLYLKYFVATAALAVKAGAETCIDSWNTNNFDEAPGPFMDGVVYRNNLKNGNGTFPIEMDTMA